MAATKRVDDALLAAVAREARVSPRLRRNHNFHSHEEPVQRLLNALQPGTYVRPHRHRGEGSFEFFCVLQGAVGCLTFDDTGVVLEACRLDARGGAHPRGIEISGDIWHALVCLAPDTVILEIKEGPYDATNGKEWLAGYPDEFAALQGATAVRAQVDATIAQWASLFK